MSWPLLVFLTLLPIILHLALGALATAHSSVPWLNFLLYPCPAVSFLEALTGSVPNATYALLLFSIWLALVHVSTPSWGIFSPPRRLTQTCRWKKFLFLCIPEQTSSLWQNIHIIVITLPSVKRWAQRGQGLSYLSSYPCAAQNRTT